MFYESIKKEALNKIDYMYSNKKYYDHQEVKHLQSVIASCNILIHKKHTKIDAKPLYNVPKSASNPKRVQLNNKYSKSTINIVNSKTYKSLDLKNHPQNNYFSKSCF